MSKCILIPSLLIFTTALSAQQVHSQYIHQHLVRADASIVRGYMFRSDLKNVHLNGNLEYYLDNKISVRGDANYMLGSIGNTEEFMFLKDDISVMLGCTYHFKTENHFDPYVIFQPGVAYTSSYIDLSTSAFEQGISVDGVRRYNGSLSPLASVGVGANYYFQRFAHLFLETRYVHGQHLSEAPSPISLDELRITFGLGFNVFIIKERKRPG
jgi:hypothetical protein